MSEIIDPPKLDVYYNIDLNNDFDLSYIEYYLRVYLNIHKKSYVINKFENCENYIIKNNTKIVEMQMSDKMATIGKAEEDFLNNLTEKLSNNG